MRILGSIHGCRSVSAKVLNEASTRNNRLWFYTEVKTDEVSQAVIDDVRIDVRPTEANKFGDNIFMQESDGDEFLGSLVGDLDVECIFDGQNEFDSIKTHASPNYGIERASERAQPACEALSRRAGRACSLVRDRLFGEQVVLEFT
jgi:hypothetical protein